MINFYKKKGETPLEALNRLRSENFIYKNEVLSYAGRLDPMAEGILPILVGCIENKNRKEYLHKDKEYQATFLIGCSTDTGDILGLVDKIDFSFVDTDIIIESILKLVHKDIQIYPWYSSKTVNGIPLFEYARKKEFNIIRPQKNITIYSVTNIFLKNKKINTCVDGFIEDIKRVTGDFRQEQITNIWQKISKEHREQVVPLISCTIRVSSGTYIRGLVEDISKKINKPVMLYRLIRTKIL